MMRNKEYTLEKELPPHIRLEVYKEALEIVREGGQRYNEFGEGLCLLLPCVLWGLTSFLKNSPTNTTWNARKTPKAFPELTEEWLNRIRREGKLGRVFFLEESIKQLENDNNSITA
jgi:hypothetical protein